MIKFDAPSLTAAFVLGDKGAFRSPASALSLTMEGHSINPALALNADRGAPTIGQP
jgi:hypothetical protein